MFKALGLLFPYLVTIYISETGILLFAKFAQLNHSLKLIVLQYISGTFLLQF